MEACTEAAESALQFASSEEPAGDTGRSGGQATGGKPDGQKKLGAHAVQFDADVEPTADARPAPQGITGATGPAPQ
jgi:hypothetical protein